MVKLSKKFKKVVVLDTVIFYPEHRVILGSIAEEVLEYPTSLPEGLERQYEENPELFLNKKCYTQIAVDNVPLQLLMDRVEGADVIVSCWTDIPDEILKLNPNLKLVIFWTHEKEHRINLQLAKELGIVVANIPDYGTDAVAEVVFAGLWELLKRNFPPDGGANGKDQTMHAIMADVFSKFRKLEGNEKYTRAGKFIHHFHKIGMVKFDFSQKNLDDLIPERLIEYKRVGLLNLKNTDGTIKALTAFNVICQEYCLKDSSLATYYKFLAENDLIYYDSREIDEGEIKKAEALFAGKIFDVNGLPSADYLITGKIFGIVGLGRIGIKVARIAKNLGFDVVYYSKTRKQDLERELGIRYFDLAELAKVSDIVSIHVSAHRAENLFDGQLIKSMKPGVLFINSADGNAIDQKVLVERMVKGEVLAYLDVYPGLPRKDILGLAIEDKTDWKIHKLLPHCVFAYRAGWKTQESIRVKTYKLLGEMIDFLMNKKDEYMSPEEL